MTFADDKPSATFWVGETLCRNGENLSLADATLGHLEPRAGVWGFVVDGTWVPVGSYARARVALERAVGR